VRRDAFYDAILDRLDGELEGQAFEDCMSDLLRQRFPSVVPVRGGDDAGMDSAVADGNGPPWPVIITTEDDVLGNLTKSLKTYLAHGGARRQVALATSRALTPRRHRNLEARAREFGFTLVDIIDRPGVANLLYRDPVWCERLLGLTGEPPVLTPIPPGRRPLVDQPLVGRDAELRWLRERQRDGVLVGQPGAGKTFLLYARARESGGLFARSDDLGAIVQEMRASEGGLTLFVDDGHARQELLSDLVWERRQSGAKYRIVAATWPGAAEAVRQCLNLARADSLELPRFGRDAIVMVIQGAGVRGPNPLLHELVAQSDGLPGLAVTLAQLCLAGDVQWVAEGFALADSVRATVRRLVGTEGTQVLGAFSLGGGAGMKLSDVAEALGMPVPQVREVVDGLAAAGVLHELGSGTLAVRPPRLRGALVKETFFCGARSLGAERLVVSGRPEGVAEALVDAYRCGAPIDPDFLLDKVRHGGTTEVWMHYTALGSSEATRALQERPDLLLPLAQVGLVEAPEAFLPALLESAVGDTRDLHPHPEHPLRKVEDWVKAARPGRGLAVSRRKQVVAAAVEWLQSHRDKQTGWRALSLALDPECTWTELDPGAGRSLSVFFGGIAADELVELGTCWSDVLAVAQESGLRDWRMILGIVANWAYSGRIEPHLDVEQKAALFTTARQMLQDIVHLAADRPGVMHRVKEMVSHLALDLEVPTDPVFEIVFPSLGEDIIANSQVAAGALAREWKDLDTHVLELRLSRFQREAEEAGCCGLNLCQVVRSIVAQLRTDSN
jgi:hypothetical protein